MRKTDKLKKTVQKEGNMNPQVFGWEHFTFLAVYIVLSVVSLILIKHFAKSTKSQDIIVRCVGLFLFSMLLWNRIEIAVSNKNAAYLLPDTFCGMSSLVLALATMFGKRNNNVLHFVFYFSVLGCIATLVYPDFIGQSTSIFYGKTFSGLMHHAMSLYQSILICTIGWFIPNYKKSWNVVIGFLAYITIGTFQIAVFKLSDAFYINHPILSGTPLTVWVMIPMFIGVYTIFMVIFELIRRRKHKKADNQTIEKSSQKI